MKLSIELSYSCKIGITKHPFSSFIVIKICSSFLLALELRDISSESEIK